MLFHTITPDHCIKRLILIATLSLTACGSLLGTHLTPTPSATPLPPTPTPEPALGIVNGERITTAEFQAELERFQDAQTAKGNSISPEEARQRVLDDLIDQVLLAQGARAAGFEVDDALLQTRIEALTAQIGDPEALSTWQSVHGYTSNSFHAALRRAMAAAWMRDQIIASVPATTEQVHIQQILLYNEDTARDISARLSAGADFEALAAKYDPITRGDLGWCPRGYLLEAKIEAAAFALQPGQTSDVIATDIGFHIIKVLERDQQHPLSPDAYLVMQNLALSDWLRQQRERSTIVLTP